MILLDAYALVALLAGEAAGAEVEQLLRDGQTGVTSVNLAEAIERTRRVHEVPHAKVRHALEALLGPVILVLAPAEREAWRAADLRARYYDRSARAVSIADCFLLAAAGSGDSIATSDPAVAATARDEAIEVVALPDSAGRRP